MTECPHCSHELNQATFDVNGVETRGVECPSCGYRTPYAQGWGSGLDSVSERGGGDG